MSRSTTRTLIGSRVGRHLGFPPGPAQPGGTPPSSGDPVLPRSMPSAAMPTSFGTEWFVNDAASWRAALAGSVIGDVITCDHTAARIQGNVNESFTFPVKAGAGPGAFVTIRTDAWASLPALDPSGFAPGFAGHAGSGINPVPGTLTTANNPRCGPAQSPLVGPRKLARFRASASTSGPGPAVHFLKIAPGGGGLYLWGLDIDCAPDTASPFTVSGLLRLGMPQTSEGFTSLSQIVHDVVVQQCYVHSNASGAYGDFANYHSCSKAIYTANDRLAIVNSTIIAEHTQNGDANAILVLGGRGPVVIDNNLIAGNGENFLSGGGDLESYYTGILPSDYTISRNHFYKPDIWLKGTTAFHDNDVANGGTGAGTVVNYPTKNPCEIKYMTYALIEGNVFDGNTNNGQNGQGFTIKVVDQSGGMPWTETANITVRYNIQRRITQGYSLVGRESGPCGATGNGTPLHDILFEHNLTDIRQALILGGSVNRGPSPLGGCTYARSTLACHDWQFRNETTIGQTTFWYLSGFGPTLKITNFLMDSCVFADAPTASFFGFFGDAGEGNGSLNAHTDAATRTFLRNVLTHRSAASYPAGNYFPLNDAASGLNADGTLAAGSPLLAGGAMQGRNGLANGCDMTTLAVKTGGVVLP